MILSKMTLLGAALGVAAVIGSAALAWVHKGRQRLTTEMPPIMSSDRTAN